MFRQKFTTVVLTNDSGSINNKITGNTDKKLQDMQR